MSARTKFHVKNVIQGRHIFSYMLASRNSRILSSFSRLAVPRVIPLCRPDCDYYKQACVKRGTPNHAEALIPRKLENLFLERVSSEKPVTSNWIDQVLTGSSCTPACGLPWESSYIFYHDKKCPKSHCPPSSPNSRTDCPQKCPVPACPPPKSTPPRPKKLRCNPCYQPKKIDPCAKTTPCTLKTILLYNCRFYSADPCKPKDTKPDPCKPKETKEDPCKPKTKASNQDRCSPSFKPKPKQCEPKTKSHPCGGQPEAKKDDRCSPSFKPKPKLCEPKAKQHPCGENAEPQKGPPKKGPVCP